MADGPKKIRAYGKPKRRKFKPHRESKFRSADQLVEGLLAGKKAESSAKHPGLVRANKPTGNATGATKPSEAHFRTRAITSMDVAGQKADMLALPGKAASLAELNEAGKAAALAELTAAAARIQVTADRKSGRATKEWIARLAGLTR